jgi:hypothetical protein
MLKIFFTLVLCLHFSLQAQTSWDSLVIEKDRIWTIKYTHIEVSHGNIADTSREHIREVIRDMAAINDWWLELNQFTDTTQLLPTLGIDTLQILQKTESLIALYPRYYKRKIYQNSKQKEFLRNLLGNTYIYKQELKNTTLTEPYHYRYAIKFYSQKQLIAHYTSQKSSYLSYYLCPYINQNNQFVYNFKVDKLMANLFGDKTFRPLKNGKTLLKYLTTSIINKHLPTIKKLAAYTYQTEIEALQTDFRLISFEGVYQRSKFLGYVPNTIKVVLQSKEMLPNVYLNFIASTTPKSMHRANDLKKSYQGIVSRLQNIGFLRDYLLKDTTAKLDIYYFDNKAINDHVIDEANGSPEQWERYDDRKRRSKLSTTDSVKKANQESLLAIYKKMECGCDYRWGKEFIEKAVVFTITDANNFISAWLLLPDDTLLLYRVDSRKIETTLVINQPLTNFSPDATSPSPCLLLDKNGKLIPKN